MVEIHALYPCFNCAAIIHQIHFCLNNLFHFRREALRRPERPGAPEAGVRGSELRIPPRALLDVRALPRQAHQTVPRGEGRN